MYKVKSIMKQSLPVILATITISSIAGISLTTIRESLFTIPFLIMVVPALNNMVGDFSCMLTSKLSTSFKMGYSRIARNIIIRVVLVGVLTSLYLAILGWTIDSSIAIEKAIMLVFFTSLSLILVLVVVTYLLTIILLEKDIDPDNVIIPIATSLADVLSVVVFAFMVRIIL